MQASKKPHKKSKVEKTHYRWIFVSYKYSLSADFHFKIQFQSPLVKSPEGIDTSLTFDSDHSLSSDLSEGLRKKTVPSSTSSAKMILTSPFTTSIRGSSCSLKTFCFISIVSS